MVSIVIDVMSTFGQVAGQSRVVADTLIRALEELLKCDEFQAEILNSAKLVTGRLPQKKTMRKSRQKRVK